MGASGGSRRHRSRVCSETMPVYKGKRAGTWRVVIWQEGRPTEHVVRGKKPEAVAFEARKRVELGQRPTTRTAPSFAAFCVEVYTPHAKTHLRKSTWGQVRRYQVETLIRHLGPVPLDQLGLEHVERYKRARLEAVEPTSVNNELRVLRTVLNYARAIPYPCSAVTWKKLPTRGAGRVCVWSADDVAKLYDATRAEVPELLGLLVFLANTGCRKGEAIACEWSWIDFARELVCIPSNEVWRPKNGLPREIPLSRSLRAALEAPRQHERWVFPTRHGGRFACFPEELFRRARAGAELVGGPHTLRHTFASLFLAAVPDMFLLGKVLGHSHQRVTELYSHLLPDHLGRARNAVDLAPGP